MPSASVTIEQISPTASKANARGHELIIDRPDAKGGTNQGMMGGEAVLNGLGGCFMSTLFASAAARDIDIQNAKATIVGELADGPARFTAISMTVSAQCNPPEEFEKLVKISEKGCIAANTLGKAVELSINIQ